MKADKYEVANSLAMNPDYLKPVEVFALPKEIFATIADDIKERGCYTNSVVAGVGLGARSVVLGAVYCNKYGLSCEHAWIELEDGLYVDPTYQCLDHYNPSDYEYFSLFTVQFDEYLEIAESIRGDADMALDIFCTRRSPLTKHLFAMHRVSTKQSQ